MHAVQSQPIKHFQLAISDAAGDAILAYRRPCGCGNPEKITVILAEGKVSVCRDGVHHLLDGLAPGDLARFDSVLVSEVLPGIPAPTFTIPAKVERDVAPQYH